MFEPQTNTLFGILKGMSPSESARRESLEEARLDLGLEEKEILSSVCVAYALLRLRIQPEVVSRLLSWREFEELAGALLRASGFDVRENVVLTKPRVQIDAVAFGTSIILSVDCKHYRREPGLASLKKFAEAQLRRSGLLRKKMKDPRPIASVILSLSEPEGTFVDGVAVVPIRTLRSFLNSLDSYNDLLELR